MIVGMNRALLFAGSCAATLAVPVDARALPAFPGAEGFGTETVGGRGGSIVRVTNLSDQGPGSLREALEVATGARIVFFDVGGTIVLTRDIRIRDANSFVTVAGQTAPGDGIQLKNYSIAIRDGAHDIVVRHLRLRPGNEPDVANDPTMGDKDGILIWGNGGSHVYNVVIDHCSLEWATDENVNVYDWATDVTIQWSIIAEASITHWSGRLGKGFLSANDPRITLSVHHDLFAHNADRSPKIDNGDMGVADLVNNVVFDWLTNNGTKIEVGARANVVANTWVSGPASTDDRAVFIDDDMTGVWPQLWLEGNHGPLCPNGCSGNEWAVGVWLPTGMAADPSTYGAPAPFTAPPIAAMSADAAYDAVLMGAGATRPARDSVDARIVADVMAGTGAIGIGSAYPSLADGMPPLDGDGDGMPDAWETMYGLDPNDPSDGNADANGDGYTNVEEYLNERDPNAPPMTGQGGAGAGGASQSGSGSAAGGSMATSGANPAGGDSGCGCRTSRSNEHGTWAWIGLLSMWLGRRRDAR